MTENALQIMALLADEYQEQGDRYLKLAKEHSVIRLAKHTFTPTEMAMAHYAASAGVRRHITHIREES